MELSDRFFDRVIGVLILCAISATIASILTYLHHKRKSDLHIRICAYQIGALVAFLKIKGYGSCIQLPDNELFNFKTQRFNNDNGWIGRYRTGRDIAPFNYQSSDCRNILFKENLSKENKYHVQLLSMCDEAQLNDYGGRLDPHDAYINSYIYDKWIALFTKIKFHDSPDTFPERTESDLTEEIRLAVGATIRGMPHSEIRESIDAALWMLTYSAVTTAEKFVDSDDCY